MHWCVAAFDRQDNVLGGDVEDAAAEVQSQGRWNFGRASREVVAQAGQWSSAEARTRLADSPVRVRLARGT
jgi:hypothetical protein